MSRVDKAAVLIDGGYIRAILRDYFGETRVNYLKLSEELCGDCERFRTYYYICPPFQSTPPTPREQKMASDMDTFLYNLRRSPRFEVRLGRLRRTGDKRHPFEQKGVDVLLSIDLTQLTVSRSIQRAILVTGDSDFCPAVRIAKENMALVDLVFYPSQVSDELYDICDERVQITQALIDKVRL